MKRTTFPCSILPSTTYCPCGGEWKRINSHIPDQKTSICKDCDSIPQLYRIRKFYREAHFQISYDKRGNTLRTFDQAVDLNKIIDEELCMGIFNKDHYRKKDIPCHINRTVSEFIEEHVLPIEGDKMDEEERIFMRDWMAPYFSDVGVFVVSTIHLQDFLNTFRFRQKEAAMARSLFSKLMSHISL